MYSHISSLERYNKIFPHISVDGSGSMNGRKWEKAITSTVAMCKAAEMAGISELLLVSDLLKNTNH